MPSNHAKAARAGSSAQEFDLDRSPTMSEMNAVMTGPVPLMDGPPSALPPGSSCASCPAGPGALSSGTAHAKGSIFPRAHSAQAIPIQDVQQSQYLPISQGRFRRTRSANDSVMVPASYGHRARDSTGETPKARLSPRIQPRPSWERAEHDVLRHAPTSSSIPTSYESASIVSCGGSAFPLHRTPEYSPPITHLRTHR